MYWLLQQHINEHELRASKLSVFVVSLKIFWFGNVRNVLVIFVSSGNTWTAAPGCSEGSSGLLSGHTNTITTAVSREDEL